MYDNVASLNDKGKTMITDIRILTQLHHGVSHRESLVQLNWGHFNHAQAELIWSQCGLAIIKQVQKEFRKLGKVPKMWAYDAEMFTNLLMEV